MGEAEEEAEVEGGGVEADEAQEDEVPTQGPPMVATSEDTSDEAFPTRKHMTTRMTTPPHPQSVFHQS
jgi:hypothetical protein